MTSPKAPQSSRTARRGRRGIPVVLALLFVALLAAGLRPRPLQVETASPVRGDLRVTINEEGKTRVRQRYLVSAPIGGQLRRLPLKEGAEVTAQVTVVAVIDPTPSTPLDARSRSLAEARRDTARAQLDKSQTAQRFAATDLERAHRLHREGTVSQQELEAVQWREASASKDLAAAQSSLREAEAQLAEFSNPASTPASPPTPPVEVRAPASGRILRVIEENARVVPAGTPLVEIGDPTDLEIVIDVLSRDGAAIAPGAEVELHHWGAEPPLAARVRLVEPAAFTKVSALGVEEQRVNVIADLLTPPAQRPGLGHQFRVEARIVAWRTNDVLKVPVGALFRRGTSWCAFVIENGQAVVRTLETGGSNGTETQVTAGLQEKDTLILYPGDRIREHLRVRPVTIQP
ncbi:MAG: HlyD family efflux transporter periplasmic adaptor subunit [Verrucomicrobiales bacterium]|nr:HlyD family efflux transporter periplasmic adaptor subunit [Verrucomicrobiales bacterium]